MSASTEPLVTVIVCVYNAGQYLRPSIESLLGQTYRHLEVLIVDDGSTDGCIDTIADLRDPRIRLIRQENLGKPIALNRALDQMRGEFYAIHDADDVSHPRRIERQAACMLAHPEVAAVYCGYDVILDETHMAPICRAKTAEQCRQDIMAMRMPSHDPTGMYRWSLVRDFRYTPELRIGQGVDYILRVGERYPMMVLEECLYSYRIHRNSNTKRDPAARGRMIQEVMRRARERRGEREDRDVAAGSPATGSHRVRDNNLAAHFIDSVCSQKQRGRIAGAIKAGMQCLALHPRDPHYWKAFIYAVVPMPVIDRIRANRAGVAR